MNQDQPKTKTQPQKQERIEPFYPGSRLPYICPRCDAGGLVLVEDTLKYVATPWTRDGDEGGYLDQWDGETRFSCLLQCSNPRCEEIVLCGGSHHLTEDWSTGHQKYVPVCYPKTMVVLDAGREMSTHSSSDRTTSPTMPLRLDPTDENILRLLLDNAPHRLVSSAIAQKLGQPGVGKNLSKLHQAGLIQTRSRKGYRLTDRGAAVATEIVGDREP